MEISAIKKVKIILMEEKNYYNKRQDEDIKEIKNHIAKLNEEVGGIKVEMATKFGEVLEQIATLKASKKEIIYAILLPILMAFIGFLIAKITL